MGRKRAVKDRQRAETGLTLKNEGKMIDGRTAHTAEKCDD